jgi:DNA modification methylase
MDRGAKVIIGDSRSMEELHDESIDLIVTSPPYWQIKDYGILSQIGYGQSLHEYLRDIYRVWTECYRVLKKGGRFCLNIGDQFARSVIYGRYKVIPIHAEFIGQCEQIGLDFMGSIVWQKKTTLNTTGGATVMGSFPYPPNGIVEIDYEFVHILKKTGERKKVSREVRDLSRLTKKEWKEYFSGHWYFGGAKQLGHEAMFPEELPKRLIKMFSFVGDTVLDPFLGSGTTLKVALDLKRNAVGYEINEEFLKIIRKKMGVRGGLFQFDETVQIIKRRGKPSVLPEIDYVPRIQDARPSISPDKFKFKGDRLYKVTEIVDERTVRLDTGRVVQFLGVRIDKKEEVISYLQSYILGKKIFLTFDTGRVVKEKDIAAYVYLKNKIFVNSYLVKSGLASPDFSIDHKYKDNFTKLWKEGRGSG